jgi:uncharacterized cofD-like protein
MTGPAVVAVGGGHGLAATLGALRRLPVGITAVVSVADDGGSTGRLRADRDRVAPGDLRKCLVALAGEPSPLSRLMEHRFEFGEMEGHSFGNLLLAAMEESEGDLLVALDGVAAMLGAVGRVVPATTDVVELVAELDDGGEVAGQAGIVLTPGIARVRLEPEPKACPRALDAIEQADLLVLGPGSLFTSVLAAAVVPGIAEAVAESPAQVVYVCNLAPQPRETEGYSVADHVAALGRHGLFPDVVLHDPGRIGGAEGVAGAVAADLAGPSGRAHDRGRLAEALSRFVV